MRRLRLCVVGLGTVGQWLLRALGPDRGDPAERYGFTPSVVAVANARDGLVADPAGLDPRMILALVAKGRSIAEHPGVRHWRSALEGLSEIEADVVAEVSSSPLPDAEPGYTHMRESLRRGIAVATSNKWPVALHGVELANLARERGVAFRAESTVMSGTPILSTLTEGLAGARPTALRGLLNATVNFILSEMAAGRAYEDALSEAQRIGLAEADPSADVDGFDEMAKAMVLAGLVFGRQVTPEDVARRGISTLGRPEIARARSEGARIKSVTRLDLSEPGGSDEPIVRVEPVLLAHDDPLAGVDGAANAIVCHAEPVGEVTVIGPGAGLSLAGQGVLSDLIAIAERSA